MQRRWDRAGVVGNSKGYWDKLEQIHLHEEAAQPHRIRLLPLDL